MSEKQALRKALREMLKQHRILPYTNWGSFEIQHEKPKSTKEQNSVYQIIEKNVGEKYGVYIYEKDEKILYVGQGILKERIKSHYIESFKDPQKKSWKWYAFFSRHRGTLKVYWKECEDEESRKAYEGMLIFVLKPAFESFGENRNF